MVSASNYVDHRQNSFNALAALLALLFVVAASVSVCHGLHRALHGDSDPGHPYCLACAVAKAQLHNADPVIALALITLLTISPLFLLQIACPSALHLRFARGRDPPH